MARDKVSAQCRSHFILTLLLMLAAGVSSAMAQTPADSIDGRTEALNAILPNYIDWQTAAMSGKLRMKKLPVSPSVGIFMRRNETISISVGASLLGEVGRIDIEGDTLLAVNKMKRVYCKESLAGIKYDYPDIIGDIQSLLRTCRGFAVVRAFRSQCRFLRFQISSGRFHTFRGGMVADIPSRKKR